jgi:hypothetical protein
MCGRSKDELPLEVDHLLAVANGGTDELANLATLCRDCNAGKSAYRFTDYRTVSVAPPDLDTHFAFFKDDPVGDFSRYHLYLYYKQQGQGEAGDAKFHRAWTISRTAFATSSSPAALEQRRRGEEASAFVIEIRRALVAEGKRIVQTEEGLCKVDG